LERFKQKVSPEAVQQVYKSWLSEQPGMDYTIYSYLRYAFESKTSIEKDYSHPAVLIISDTAKKVHREKHRMEAFIRFQLTRDQLYFAIIEPDFDVLPLIKKHFEARYADQRWMVYDARRRYGLYYDLEKVDTVNVNFEENNHSGKYISAIYDEKEELYQKLWQRYFASVNIKARRNMKLHIQHMPLRYWKYLTEKQP
jgi:probable DNA metabolism protein